MSEIRSGTSESQRPEWLLVTVALGAALALSAPAQGQVIRDGSIGPGMDVQPAGPHYEIPADMGEQAGGNLFHSFEDFNLHTVGGVSESATFTPEGASGPIDNVVSRVTGGRPSEIDGPLRSTISGADFYFLNPAGLMFGPNARLDLRGSFHASTADQLELASGDAFEARSTGVRGLLSVAPPEDFGFLASNTSSISIEGSDLFIQNRSPTRPRSTLSLSGAGDVYVGERTRLAVDGFFDDDGGLVTLRGRDVTLGPHVTVSTSVHGPGTGKGGEIRIRATDSVTLAPSSSVSARAFGDGDSGQIRIVGANQLTLMRH